MAGYYRKFCCNFVTVTEPLTYLRFNRSLGKLKVILSTEPVLSVAVDVSEVAAGAVLLQEGEDSIDHPVCYISPGHLVTVKQTI